LKQRLATDPKLRLLLAQYVPLELDVSDPEYRIWENAYRPSDNYVPAIYIVGSDGRQIYNGSGVPRGEGLVRLLVAGIEQTGGYKDVVNSAAMPDEEKRLAVVREVRQMLALGQTAAAVGALVPLLAEDNGADRDDVKTALKALGVTIKNDSGSLAKKESVELAQHIAGQARMEIDQAVRTIESQDRALARIAHRHHSSRGLAG